MILCRKEAKDVFLLEIFELRVDMRLKGKRQVNPASDVVNLSRQAE